MIAITEICAHPGCSVVRVLFFSVYAEVLGSSMNLKPDRRNFMTQSAAAAAALYLATGHARSHSSARVGDESKPLRIEPFDYRGVRLLDGLLLRQFVTTRDYFYEIPDDDIVFGFRRRAGLEALGNELPGLYGKDIWNAFGQWLSGMARASCATSDQQLGAKASRLLAEWVKCIGPDGYFYYSRSPMTPHYTYEKTVCGLADMHLYLGDAQALPALEKITDWAIGNLDRSRNTPTPSSASADGTEWYTLSENLYRAYEATGKTKYRVFGDLWRYSSYWESVAEGSSPAFFQLHAYSHVNTLSSLAMTYAMTGDSSYLRVLVNAYHYLAATQLYATGGYGPGERLLPPDGSLGKSLEITRDSFETPSGSWAGFKLARYLMCFTGEARFGDWIEKLVYNGIGAALPMKDVSLLRYRQNTFYYSDYSLGGGFKTYRNVAFPCCSGTYIQAVADYHNLIYFRGKKSLYVNLYVPSQGIWNCDGTEVRVEQETSYPESDTAVLTIRPAKKASFDLRFRVPGWCHEVSADVNGIGQPITAAPGQWATISREWSSGDQVTIRITMRLAWVPVDNQHPYRVALTHGPVVLIGKHQPQLASLGPSLEHLMESSGTPLAFRLSPQTQLGTIYVPFYRVGPDKSYGIYFDFQT